MPSGESLERSAVLRDAAEARQLSGLSGAEVFLMTKDGRHWFVRKAAREPAASEIPEADHAATGGPNERLDAGLETERESNDELRDRISEMAAEPASDPADLREIRDSLGDLQAKVLETGADLGLAHPRESRKVETRRRTATPW